MKISVTSENIKIANNSYYAIDETIRLGHKFFLLEDEELGDLDGLLIVDENCNVLFDNTFEGFNQGSEFWDVEDEEILEFINEN